MPELEQITSELVFTAHLLPLSSSASESTRDFLQ